MGKKWKIVSDSSSVKGGNFRFAGTKKSESNMNANIHLVLRELNQTKPILIHVYIAKAGITRTQKILSTWPLLCVH